MSPNKLNIKRWHLAVATFLSCNQGRGDFCSELNVSQFYFTSCWILAQRCPVAFECTHPKFASILVQVYRRPLIPSFSLAPPFSLNLWSKLLFKKSTFDAGGEKERKIDYRERLYLKKLYKKNHTLENQHYEKELLRRRRRRRFFHINTKKYK